MERLAFRIRRPSAAIIAVAALLAVLGTGIITTRATGATVGAKFYNPGDFLPGDNETGFAAIGVGSLTCLSSPNIEGNAGFVASLDLPDGSKVTKVVYYYTDNHSSANLSFHFGSAFIMSNETRAADLVDPVSSGGASPTAANITQTAPAPVAVANAVQDTLVSVEFGACDQPEDLVFHGARVFYTKP